MACVSQKYKIYLNIAYKYNLDKYNLWMILNVYVFMSIIPYNKYLRATQNVIALGKGFAC